VLGALVLWVDLGKKKFMIVEQDGVQNQTML